MPPGPGQQTIVSWNALLARSVQNGEYAKTVELYQEMQREGMHPDTFTFVPVLKACAGLGDIEKGKHIQTQIIESGFESNIFVGSSLIDMFTKYGRMEDAQNVFEMMPVRDVVVWTAMIKAYVKCGQGHKALELFEQMQVECVKPDIVAFVGVINACTSMMALEEGEQIHAQVIECGLESNLFVSSSLVDMYAKCGSLEDAQNVFDKMPKRDVVPWNSLILGYAKCGQGEKGLELFERMQMEHVRPNRVTFIGVLNACISIAALDKGRLAHEQIIKHGLDADAFVSSSLVDMYAKCGSIEDAWRVFSSMTTRDVATWNAMILGYVKCGFAQNALELSEQMQMEGIELDHITFVGILNACADVVALERGRNIHAQITQSRWKSDVYVKNALIDMYAKCGSVKEAWAVFETTDKRDVVCWSTMLGGYAINGHAYEVFRLFEQMQEQGVEMNDVTFICLLSACSHGGLVDEGLEYFESLCPVYGVLPRVAHYTCLVDLLGRAGHLQEAEEVIETMLCEPDVTVWKALLSACTVHGNVEKGESIAKEVVELDPENSAGYVLLSNIYTAAGKWDSSTNIQQLRR